MRKQSPVITQMDRRHVGCKVKQMAFPDEVAELNRRSFALAHRIYRSMVSEEQEAAMRALPREFFCWRDTIRVEHWSHWPISEHGGPEVIDVEDFSRNASVKLTHNFWFSTESTSYPIPYNVGYRHVMHLVDFGADFTGLKEDLLEFLQDQGKLDERVDKLVKETDHVLMQMRTKKRLRESAPEIAKLLPQLHEDPEPPKQLPTTDVSKVVSMLADAGIPPAK